MTTRDIRPSTAHTDLRRLRTDPAARGAGRGLSSTAGPGARSASCASPGRCTRAGCARARFPPTTRARPARPAALAVRPAARAPRGRGRRAGAAERRVRPITRRRRAVARRRRPEPAARALGPGQRAARAGREPRSGRARAPPRAGGAHQHRAEDRLCDRALQLAPSTRARWPGSARSLGLPDVAVRPLGEPSRPGQRGRLVGAVLVSLRGRPLADEVPSVRVAGQGYELDELDRRGAPGKRGGRRARPALARRLNRRLDEHPMRAAAGRSNSICAVIYCVFPKRWPTSCSTSSPTTTPTIRTSP